jgi:hypothetical protein
VTTTTADNAINTRTGRRRSTRLSSCYDILGHHW